jgi:uncharacterized protein YbjT (DUF2867 family)
MENFLWFADGVKHDGVLALPFERSLAPIATADVTRAVACTLRDAAAHHGKCVTLTGPQALTGSEVAAELSKALGHSVGFKKLTGDQARDVLKAKGLSATTSEPFLALCDIIDRGDTYMTSNAFQVLTEAVGTPIQTFFRKHRAIFVSQRED